MTKIILAGIYRKEFYDYIFQIILMVIMICSVPECTTQRTGQNFVKGQQDFKQADRQLKPAIIAEFLREVS
ncbi:MAG: hypothetical protein LUQ26_01595 [Methylococcaceae bacterium]|nr:hypothetical protein [Methylococcaceae bacterium]